MRAPAVYRGLRKAGRRLRGARVTWWIRMGGGRVGRGLEVETGFSLRWGPHGGLHFGDGVRFGRGVVLDVPAGATLRLGDGVKVMHYSVIAAAERLSIGAGTQVAEHCSLRDSNHGLDLARPIADQSVSEPTRIGADVWIARGVAVLAGSDVGDQAVIGANSVVRGEVPARAIAVGAPVRVVRLRE